MVAYNKRKIISKVITNFVNLKQKNKREKRCQRFKDKMQVYVAKVKFKFNN